MSDEDHVGSSQEDLILHFDESPLYQNQMQDNEAREAFEAYYNGNYFN